jgi:hypothetical protein
MRLFRTEISHPDSLKTPPSAAPLRVNAKVAVPLMIYQYTSKTAREAIARSKELLRQTENRNRLPYKP